MKKAFTLLELVFVIVVVGILAATIAPRYNRDSLQEAADKLISHLRYTKHLAMVDEKYDNNNLQWYKERWQLKFSKSVDGVEVWAYTIFSDNFNHDGNPNISDDIAKNPTNPNMYLSGGYSGILTLSDSRRDKTMALEETYGIKDVKFMSCGTTNAKRIAFDYLGRPIGGDLSSSIKPYQSGRLLSNQCQIVLCKNKPCDDNNITIAIEPITGYIHII